ncbi:MAG TPA: hypothetical protein PKJ68_04040 [Candidatus Woesebacteria bacterium]|nr:hypothetical protein [Candidatus Woesebacteria bacterium]
MIKNIEDVKSLCELGLKNLPGVRSMSFTDAANINEYGVLNPLATIYKVAYRNWSGEIRDEHQLSRAGDYYVKSIEVYVPRYRAVCERIIEELMDRKVAVFATDKNGQDHQIHFATFSSKMSTGRRGGDSNGYVWTFTGKDRKKRFLGSLDEVDMTGESGVPPAADEPNLSPAPDPETPMFESCCVTVLVTPIPEAPLPTGNILNLNKFVTVAGSGEKYFIDKDGTSILLTASLFRERIIGDGSYTYTLSHDYDPDKVIINRTQNTIIRELAPPPTEIHTFDIQGDQLILPEDWPLEPGEYVEIYQVA